MLKKEKNLENEKTISGSITASSRIGGRLNFGCGGGLDLNQRPSGYEPDARMGQKLNIINFFKFYPKYFEIY